jgi:hypothetical protein
MRIWCIKIVNVLVLHEERSHCVDVHVIKGACPIIVNGITAHSFKVFFEKCFVFAILPKPFVHITKGMLFPTV